MTKKIIVQPGKKYGLLTVVREIEPRIYNRKNRKDLAIVRQVLCECNCGNEKISSLTKIMNGKTTHCGCKREIAASKAIVGDRYGKLVLTLELEKQVSANNSNKYRIGEFACDCGAICSARLDHVLSGGIKSCGCYQRESRLKHGDSIKDSPYRRLYGIWSNIKQRCSNQNHIKWYLYGGRGISVCEEWESSYSTFKIWSLSNGYEKGLQIDRIDTNGNYEPINARWETRSVNQQNLRNSKRWYVNGNKYMSLSEAAKSLKVGENTIRYWCDGRNRDGKFIPSKSGCWSELKYKEGAMQ